MYGIGGLRAVVVCVIAGCAAWLTGCSSSASAPLPTTYNLGEKIIAGHITYTVFETQWMTHLGEGLEARVPQNRFLLVRINIANGGKTAASIPNFTMVDDNGNSYDELSNGDGVPQWIGYLRSARPADSLEGNIIFDAPPGHYKLNLADDTGTSTAIVDLPLNFSPEAPTGLIPATGKK